MFTIDFYETADGFSDIKEFLESLRIKAGSSKDARIQYGQAARYIQLLQDNGPNLPVEVAKHLEDEIWELRPGNNRVFFFSMTRVRMYFCIIIGKRRKKHHKEKSNRQNQK